MKRLNFLILLLFIYIQIINGQQWSWVKPAGGTSIDYAYGVATDLTGNVFVTGSYEGTANFGTTQLTNTGQKDIFVVKYNASGNVQWAKKAAGTSVDEGTAIAVDADGNCYVTGYFSGSCTFATGTSFTSSNGKDVFIAKYNGSNGNLVWAKSVSVTGDAEGAGIAVDASGNTYITGYFRNTATFKSNPGGISLSATGGLDAFVAKYNSTGTCQWARKGGGSSLDRAYGIALQDNALLITGYFEQTATFGTTQLTSAGGGDIFVAKYDNSGTLSWAKAYGGPNTDYGHAAVLDISGNCYITGRFEIEASFQNTNLTSNGSYDIFLLKLNTDGNRQWVKNFGGTYLDYTTSIKCNKYYDALYFTGAYAVNAIFDTISLSSATNSQDMFVVKTDTSGNTLWVIDGGGLYDDVGNGIAVDTFGNIYGTGTFYNQTTTFGSINVTGYGDYDVFTAKICPMSAQIIKTDVSCHGENDGSIIVIPDGGTPPFTYTWVPNISTNDTVVNLSAGTYTVSVSDDVGCGASRQIVINEPQSMNINTSVSHITCHDFDDGFAAALASGGTPPFNYVWLTTPVQNNDTAFNLAQGTYKVIITDASGCKDSTTVNIINPSVLAAFAGNNHNVCSGNQITLGATTVATGGTTPYFYKWTPASYLNYDTLAHPIATPTNQITYTLLVTDKNGCTASDDISISITQPPNVMISQNDTICIGETSNIAANASGAISYQWSPANSLNNANIQTPVAAPTVTTTYTVTVSFTGNCYNTAQTIIIVNQMPPINTSGNQSVCEGDSVVLCANGGLTYIWQPSALLDNPFSNSPVTVPLMHTTIFFVYVTDAYGCSNTDSVLITVNPVPTPVISESYGVLSSNYAVGNQWYYNGTIIPSATSQNYTPTQNGDYTVEVSINNCSAMSPPFTAVNVNIESFTASSKYSIFPNPTNGLLQINCEDVETPYIDVRIRDLIGKLIFEETLAVHNNSFNKTINLHKFDNGIYIIEIKINEVNMNDKIILLK